MQLVLLTAAIVALQAEYSAEAIALENLLDEAYTLNSNPRELVPAVDYALPESCESLVPGSCSIQRLPKLMHQSPEWAKLDFR